jgi:hypothetical protein
MFLGRRPVETGGDDDEKSRQGRVGMRQLLELGGRGQRGSKQILA